MDSSFLVPNIVTKFELDHLPSHRGRATNASGVG